MPRRSILDVKVALLDSPVGVAVNDRSGSFTFVNQAYADLIGYTKEELLSKTYESVTHPDDLAANRELARRLWAGEIRNASYEKRYLRKDGSTVWVKNSVSIVCNSQDTRTHAIALSENITDRRVAEATSEAAEHQRRRRSTDLLRSQDWESRRFASELHDSTAQLLAGLTMTLTQLRELQTGPSHEHTLALRALDLATQCSREIRSLAYRLYPPLLEELGLPGALQTYLENARRNAGIEVILTLDPDFGRLPLDWEVTIFRVIQEGLANVFKHSGSPVAFITLAKTEREVSLDLLDRGHGFDVPAGGDSRPPGRGLGIPGMYERARSLGGRLQITSGREGTRISLTLPLERM